MNRRWIQVAWMVSVGIGLSVLSGCSAGHGLGMGLFSSASGSVSIVSTVQPVRLDADFQTALYRYDDENTADLYFSDLSMEQIEDIISGEPRPEVAPDGAQILHIHLFLTPRAGRTPIEFSASNVTLTYLILAEDAIGLYGGGGFLLPSRGFVVEPGGERFGGQMRDATLRFIDGSGGFEDRLESAVIGGTLRARLDPDGVRRIDALIDSLSRAARR